MVEIQPTGGYNCSSYVMENMELLEKTKKALRSVLISAPRGVPVRLLVGDFRMVLGYELPYRQLGFNNLDAFVHSIPDVVRLGSGLQGEPTYFAVADSKTSQILRFVASQRKPKIKKAHIPPSARKPVTGFTNKPLFSPMSGKQRPQKRGKGSPSGKWTGGGGGGHSGGGSVQCNKMRSVGREWCVNKICRKLLLRYRCPAALVVMVILRTAEYLNNDIKEQNV